jgi:hypothetical protein
MDTISVILTTLFVEKKEKVKQDTSEEIDFNEITTDSEMIETVEDNERNNILNECLKDKEINIYIKKNKKMDIIKIIKSILKEFNNIDVKNLNKTIYINDNEIEYKKDFKKIIIEENDKIYFDEIVVNNKIREDKRKTLVINILNNEMDTCVINSIKNPINIYVYLYKKEMDEKRTNIININNKYYIVKENRTVELKFT